MKVTMESLAIELDDWKLINAVFECVHVVELYSTNITYITGLQDWDITKKIQVQVANNAQNMLQLLVTNWFCSYSVFGS